MTMSVNMHRCLKIISQSGTTIAMFTRPTHQFGTQSGGLKVQRMRKYFKKRPRTMVIIKMSRNWLLIQGKCTMKHKISKSFSKAY
ncbi:hypothetical protein AQUCO_03000096v1 [Aquilegia coerulea]|uniref:Uncharacterized protein n=1 Tax=Aquilegia coerulea TaxID=218851 RepID=A0A2G5D168_AQUCA|nr:hypothetical protein AQUCO_03000096v1 [Aquilegia coerulea]